MISIAMLVLFMLISHVPTILFLAAWSYGTIRFYKLFLEDLVPMEPSVLEERQKARDESHQKLNHLWKTITGAENDEQEISMEKMKQSLETMKTNTENFIQSLMSNTQDVISSPTNHEDGVDHSSLETLKTLDTEVPEPEKVQNVEKKEKLASRVTVALRKKVNV